MTNLSEVYRVSGGVATAALANEISDHAQRKIEKATIADQTHISYNSRELLQLMHRHLLNAGMARSAAVLAEEAAISPLPSSDIAPSMSSSSSSTTSTTTTTTGTAVAPEESTSLEGIVLQYLRDQHHACAHPIQVLPPLSLFEPHKCPAPQLTRWTKTPTNIVSRLTLSSFDHYAPSGFARGRRTCSANYRFLYSRLEPIDYMCESGM